MKRLKKNKTSLGAFLCGICCVLRGNFLALDECEQATNTIFRELLENNQVDYKQLVVYDA